MNRLSRVFVALGAAAIGLGPARPAAAAAPPPVRHVFVIVLENKGFTEAFGPGSKAPYLATQLTAQGKLLTNYYGIGHESLDNYVALVSGQAPNPITQSDCQTFVDMLPGVIGPSDQAVGQGCVYPGAVKTVADQLGASGRPWAGFMQDMGNDPAREPKTCAHPALNSRDGTQTATATDSYATRHDPFVYFHSIIDTPACAANVVALTALPAALSAGPAAPALSFITPSLCDDGHDAPCADGRPGGLVSADAFLATWVPRILASPAYHDNGMLVVTFDEAESADATACCGEGPSVNTPSPGITGPGGGRVGAVVVSPFTRPGTTNTTAYNHYDLLRTIENLFSLSPLGYAQTAPGFGSDVFDAAAAATPAAPPPDGSPAQAQSPGSTRPLPTTGNPIPNVLLFGAATVVAGVLVGRRRSRGAR